MREHYDVIVIGSGPGGEASEIIHIGQAIMAQPGEANTLMYFINTTFNYPTMAEAYRVAALNGLNRVL
jgi:NAD(P) transhydrogenase